MMGEVWGDSEISNAATSDSKQKLVLPDRNLWVSFGCHKLLATTVCLSVTGCQSARANTHQIPPNTFTS